MLLEYSFQIKQSHIIRKLFFKKEISDTAKNREAIVALSAQSREEVDQMMDKVVDAGGRASRDPQLQEDYAWMYGRYFEDVNGHLWGIFYVDESAMNKG
jgi:predicted lactoylglutathione lyase